ncbi:MAG: hypothetical protein PHX51_08560 [Clostridia bacterium]|nr:hypothetical protein [Clostridia bacterium]
MPEYQSAVRRQLDLEYMAETFDGLLESLRQKKSMIMAIKNISEN